MKLAQVILAVLFMSLTSIRCVNTVPEGAKIEIINSVKDNQIPIANIIVKGINYYFLLDPDSKYSFIDSTFVREKDLPLTLLKEREVPNLPYIISPNAVDMMGVRLYIKDFTVTANQVESHTGKRISGVLGNDVIYSTESTINFRKDIYEQLIKLK